MDLRLNPIFAFLLVILSSPSWGQSPYYRHFDVHDGLSSATVYDVMQGSNGFIWFGTEAGVSRFDGLSFESFSKDDGLSDNEVFGMFEDPWNKVWFYPFNGKLSYYDSSGFHNPDNDPNLSRCSIRGFYTNTLRLNNQVFLGCTDKVIHVIQRNSIQKISLNNRATELLRVHGDTLFFTDWKKGTFCGIPEQLGYFCSSCRGYHGTNY